MSMDGCISGRCRTNFRRICVVVYLCLALAAVGAPKTTHAVSDIRFWVAGDTTRVAIEISGMSFFARMKTSSAVG